MRAPCWKRPFLSTMPSHTYVTGRGCFGLLHQRDRARDSAVGFPAVKDGELYSFAFALVGGGAGCVVGVADADWEEGEDAATEASKLSSKQPVAWGLNLSHGALYTKCPGKDGQSELSTQQLLALPNLGGGLILGRSATMVIEVEVDMRQRPYRLAFGVPDGPMVHAAAAIIESERLVPWVYLWGAEDAVVLLPRKLPREARMQPFGTCMRAPISSRSAQPPSPVRRSSQAATPSAALLTAASATARATASTHRAQQRLPHRPTTTAGSQPRRGHKRRAITDRGRGCAGGDLEGISAIADDISPSTTATSSTASGTSIWQPNGALEKRARAASGQQNEDPHSSSMCALTVFEARRTGSPEARTKPRSWDFMRRVTSTYNDVFAQLGPSAHKVDKRLPKQQRPTGNASGFFSIA